MVIMQSLFFNTRQRGTTMLEVLITIVILAVGLLGLAGLQARLQSSEMEAYQRAQALVLIDDMANRVATNRNAATNYVTATPLGAGMLCPTSTTTRQAIDAGQWCQALQGAAETSGASSVGSIVGGRGCIENIGSGKYMITVAWQGLTPISAPPSAVTCGQNLYNSAAAGAKCVNDLCRRVVTTILSVATL